MQVDYGGYQQVFQKLTPIGSDAARGQGTIYLHGKYLDIKARRLVLLDATFMKETFENLKQHMWPSVPEGQNGKSQELA